MAIVYHGRIEELHRELERVKPILDNRYKEILGGERYERLSEVTRITLNEKSFLSSIGELRRMDPDIQEKTPNKFIIAYGVGEKHMPDVEGRLKVGKIKTAPMFYIATAALEHSHSATLLESYIHEYDHFLWYALQKVPLYMFNGVASNALGLEGFRGVAKSMEILTEKFSSDADLSSEEELGKRFMAIYLAIIVDQYESSNRILDAMVLESIGINVKLSWRHRPREYLPLAISGGAVLCAPSGGDPYFDLSDREVVDRMLNWERHLEVRLSTMYLENFIESLKQMKVTRLNIEEFRRLAEKDKSG